MPGNEPVRTGGLGEALALLFAGLLPTVLAWLYFVTYADAAFMPVVYVLCKVVQFSFPVVWVFLVRRRRPGGVRLPREGLASGAAWGVVLFVFVWGVYLAVLRGSDLAAAGAPKIEARVEAIGAGTPLKFLLLTLGLSVAHSFLEEYYWRWFVFGRLRRLTGASTALILSSLAFAAHHVIVLGAFIGFGRFWWVTILFSIAVALGGGLWAWLYARHGSLVPPWLSHTMVDLAIMAIGYDLVWGLG